MQAMTPITPLERSEMFQRGKLQPLFTQRTSRERPLSEATEIFDTDVDDDDSSDFEEFSPKFSFNSNESRRSQTTISTLDEVHTPEDPESNRRTVFDFDVEVMKPTISGPKGPHLFRASQVSSDFSFDVTLQLSPLLPKQPPSRVGTAFRSLSPSTVVPQQEYNSLANAVAHLDTAEVRSWTSREVATWMYQNGFESDVISRFEAHDITGAVLLDLQFDDLKELEIQSFGKRHQLWNQLDSLRAGEGLISPIAPAPTPFQDISRPCTGARERSKSRKRSKSRNPDRDCSGDEGVTPGGARRRKGRKNRLMDEIVTPMESVSIVAIEQLLPKPHKCAKGERCAKWRKQQRQLARLQEEHGFPISPEKGGHIFVAGDPGNPQSANKVVENVYRDNAYRPTSDAIPSVVASSDVLGPGQLPDFSLLQHLEQRDPQDNVKNFLSLQHLDEPYDTLTPIEAPPTPPFEMFPSRCQSVPAYHEPQQPQSHPHPLRQSYFPDTDFSAPPLHPPEFTPAPHNNLKTLPKLNIPRSMSAAPQGKPRNVVPVPDSAFSPCRTASPGGVYRFGTPFSEMDVPVTAIPVGPVSRDTSQSVPPDMQYRDPIQRTTSRADWRRPSFALPPVHEAELFEPADLSENISSSGDSDTLHEEGSDSAASECKTVKAKAKGGFQYDGVNHAGWMKKRRTKMLRHEWQDHHVRLTGTQLAMHPNELPTSSALERLDVDDYAVGCSSIASNKLSAKLRALRLATSHQQSKPDTAFEFQLVPQALQDGRTTKRIVPHGKTHHFAVKTRDERIDWMRELMLAKALKAKGDGYEVNINGADM
ncbi:SAM and PH domain-containing protein [Mytilinidion resinicola]|uniref:SAM and PH domain-containing protein n=1 Tax=Mytilinidion resinicola TaxID=574789 RepID=A0A6A6YP00_9PEZI|nr:SAM and PH domain-containing protein [Mytilinidion resinicola]KAF2810471.1 SAM and PH domain-containing protein [Mytilinidion resinicola]